MRGHVRKRGNSWCYIIELPRDSNGARKQKWCSGFRNRKSAEVALSNALSSVSKGNYVEPSSITVREYLQKWLTDYVKHNCSAKTAERYSEIIRLHVLPDIGNAKLLNLNPADIQSMYSKRIVSGRVDGKGGLSNRSVHHIHRVMTNAFNTAVKWQLLAANPVKAATPPRPELKEMTALSRDESLELLRKLSGRSLWLPTFLALSTGLRRGELLGLRWTDVDWERKTLTVRRALKQTRSGLQVQKPKTKRSARTIALPDVVLEILKEHRLTQTEHRLKLGPAYGDAELVIANLEGGHVQPDTLSTNFASFIRRNPNLSRCRFHDLRHTHASLLLQAGEHVKVVSERLGHSSVAFTLDTYGHLMPGMEEAAAVRLEGLFRQARGIAV